MKVELLINLKLADGRIVNSGTIFSDEFVPIPASIMRRVNRGTARIVSSPAPIKKEVEQVIKTDVKPVVQDTIPGKPKTKKPLLKKKEK